MKVVLSENQKILLNAPLDRKNVKNRQQGGRDLSYIESWHVIAEMNRIFGFDGWYRETIYCKEVSRIECKIGKEPYRKDGYKVGYEAKVKITVGDTIREGTGHGCGTMSDLFDCIESAAKEAESDAMKRALMTFGNQFGLALYDKLQRNVEDVESKVVPFDIETEYKICIDQITIKQTKPEFISMWNNQKSKERRALIKANNEAYYMEIISKKESILAELITDETNLLNEFKAA